MATSNKLGGVKLKTGKRSQQEEILVRQFFARGDSVEKIGEYLRRTPATVKKWLIDMELLATESRAQDLERIIKILHTKPYWDEIAQQFNVEEVQYFEKVWASLLLQFREDVTTSEEMEIKQYVTLDILINRCMKDRRKHIEDIERLEGLLAQEYLKKDTDRNIDLLTNLESQVSFARNSISTYTTEYAKLLDKQQTIVKSLKAARDQRIRRIEDSKTSFSGWLKALEDEDTRERIGHSMALMSLAAKKAKEDMGEWHIYINKKADQPLLTPDNVRKD